MDSHNEYLMDSHNVQSIDRLVYEWSFALKHKFQTVTFNRLLTAYTLNHH